MSDIMITGLRGTGDWETGQEPQDWHEGILYEYPNGDAPLFALLSMLKKEQAESAIFNWWSQSLPAGAGAVTEVYINAAMSTAYVYATHQAAFGIASATLYVKTAEAVADYFRVGHQVLLRDESNPSVDLNARVTAVLKNGASSRITVKLSEADDNGSTPATYNIATVDRIQRISNINAQGAAMPDPITYNPTLFTNYCQIVENPLLLTRTAKKTKLRTPEARASAKRDAFEDHQREVELMLWNSIKTAGTGENGQPMYTSNGVIPAIKTHASANVHDFRYDAAYTGETWKDKGEEWMDEKLEIIGREGADDRMGFCGSGASNGVSTLAKYNGTLQLVPIKNAAYGLSVRQWIADSLTINLKRHPLFSKEPTDRYKIVIVPLERLTGKYIDDTFFKEDPTERQGGQNSVDGTAESFLTEMGLMYSNLAEFGILDGVGCDNVL